MKSKDSKRWFLFVIAFIVSCMIWYMVVSRENPKVNISLGNVAVTIRGGSVVHDNGYAYFIEDYDAIAVDVDVAQKKAIRVNGSDFLLTADVSECTEGENTVSVDSKVVSNRSIIGNNYSLKHDSITVKLEKLVEKEIPVQISVIGTAKDGLSYGDAIPASDSLLVKVPESLENQTYTAYATVDITDAEESITENVDLTFQNADGTEVDADALQIVAEETSMDVTVPVGKTCSLNIELPKESDYLTSGMCCTEISGESDTVDVIGPEKTLDGLEKIKITASDIKLNKAEESYKKNLDLEDYLPKGVYIKDQKAREFEIDVTIEEITEKIFEFSTDDLTVSGGKKNNISFITDSFQVRCGSSKKVIDSLKEEDFNISVNVSGLDKGRHTITPIVSVENLDNNVRFELYSIGQISIKVSGS